MRFILQNKELHQGGPKGFQHEKYKPIGISFNVNSKLLKIVDENFENVQKELKGVPYKAGIGSLVYAMMISMVNIAFAVSTIQIKG